LDVLRYLRQNTMNHQPHWNHTNASKFHKRHHGIDGRWWMCLQRRNAILPGMMDRHVYIRALAVALFALPGTLMWAHTTQTGIGEQLPMLTLRGLNGPARSLATFRGRPLLINVWASWCGPCRQEMASLERLAWRNEGRDFAIIGVSTDDDAQAAVLLLRDTRATISHFIDVNRQMETLLGASRIPLTVLVDGQGRLLARFYGAQQWDSAPALQLLHDALVTHKLRQAGPSVFP